MTLLLSALLSQPAHAASLLPATVPTTAQGVTGPVPVTLTRVVSTREPATEAWMVEARARLERFIAQTTYSLPLGLRTEGAIYRVDGADAHWVFDTRTADQVLGALDPLLDVTPFGCTPFAPPFSAAPDLLNFVVANRNAGQLPAATTALVDLVLPLGGPSAGMWQPVYQRACTLDAEGFNLLHHNAFFVDPSPLSGPDAFSYVVVLRTGYSE